MKQGCKNLALHHFLLTQPWTDMPTYNTGNSPVQSQHLLFNRVASICKQKWVFTVIKTKLCYLLSYFGKMWNHELKVRTAAKELSSHSVNFFLKIKFLHLPDTAAKTYECCLPESSCLETMLSFFAVEHRFSAYRIIFSETTARLPASANHHKEGAM